MSITSVRGRGYQKDVKLLIIGRLQLKACVIHPKIESVANPETWAWKPETKQPPNISVTSLQSHVEHN